MTRASRPAVAGPRTTFPVAAAVLAWLSLAAGAASAAEPASAAPFVLHSFDRRVLTDVYYSEGISCGDLDGDGAVDVVHGPFWFAGPDFRERRVIYGALPQPREAYANNFFSWVHDFDADGRPDVFTVGFPGTPAHVYRNPGADGFDAMWPVHEVFDWVSNESPHFTNLVGDERPELVCTRDGFFGYATIDWERPFEPWTFHRISPQVAPPRFGHGLGVGDIDGDGRLDVIMKTGWFRQPEDLEGDPMWTFHQAAFAPSGGAEMHAYDVDGDGDNDVITSLAAHEYGLSWFEQRRGEGGEVTFSEHRILGDRPAHNRFGVVFSELHSVNLADIDGDGLKDIVTGKTYWSHHRKSPGWNDGAVVYWFRLVRGPEGVDWVPHRADGDAGIGRQVVVADVDGDGLPDILAGGMKGASVLHHRTAEVDEAAWRAAQPVALEVVAEEPVVGPPAPIDPRSGVVPGALEGESMTATVTAGSAGSQEMKGFAGGRWSGNAQLFWTGGAVGDTLAFDLVATAAGEQTLEVVFTRAPDYAIVALALDDKPLGEPVDLYDFSKVTTTGVLAFPAGSLEAGTHRVTVTITGANPHAVQSRFVGLDYVRLAPARAD